MYRLAVRVVVCALALGGCALVPGCRVVESATEHLRSLAHALRSETSVTALSRQDRAWLASREGWTPPDFRGLDEILGEAYVGPRGGSLSGPDGEFLVYPQSMEERRMGIIARERNRLLAECVERGDVRPLRDLVRNRRRASSTSGCVPGEVEER